MKKVTSFWMDAPPYSVLMKKERAVRNLNITIMKKEFTFEVHRPTLLFYLKREAMQTPEP